MLLPTMGSAMLFDRAQARPVGPTTTWVACAASAAALAARASASASTTASMSFVGVSEVDIFGGGTTHSGRRSSGTSARPACHECAAAKDRPVELRHRPRVARVVGAAGPRAGSGHCGCGDVVGVHVVGVAVAAVRVIGHDDMRTQLANDRDQRPDGLTFVGVDEPPPTPLLGAGHARSRASDPRRLGRWVR